MSCAVTDVHDLSLELPATVESARAARHAVDELRYAEHGEAVFNLRLLVTELVSNSVRHADLAADEMITLEVAIRPNLIRAVVGDRGNGFGRPVFGEPPAGTSGRGLFLVDALADRWGTGKAEGGESAVWFELDLAEG